MKYINQLIESIEKKGICMKQSTAEQMQELAMIADKKRLPLAYIEFMSVMGNGTDGMFMGGDSCFMDEIKDLRDGAIELLEENESAKVLTNEDFVFWMSQGCMFCFFKLNKDENPPVYFYNENGEDDFIKIADSLTEFLINRLTINRDTFKAK